MNIRAIPGRVFARLLAPLVAAATLAGCASYNGGSLKPGVSTAADVRALMGEPAAMHAAPAGAAWAQSWEYPRGPLGRHTFMARIAADGRLVAVDQVLTVANAGRIRIGQDTREDVKRMLGRPAMIYPGRPDGEMWDYAAYADDGRPRKIRISVSFNARGVATAAGESYDIEEWSPNADGGSTN